LPTGSLSDPRGRSITSSCYLSSISPLRKKNGHFSTGFFTALMKKSGTLDEMRNYEGHKLEFDHLNPQKYDKIDSGDIQ
jgi:hypothetical protein